MIYTPRFNVNHWVMEDGGYASTFAEYTISGSKITVKSLSAISSKPLWGEEPKAKVYDNSEKQVEARIKEDKIHIGKTIFDMDKCVGTERSTHELSFTQVTSM